MSSDPKSSQSNPLGFDEFIGILIAFATIGVILFWSFSRKGDSGWNITGLQLPMPTTSASPDSGILPEQFLPRSSEPAKTPLVPQEAIPEDDSPPVRQTVPKEWSQAQTPLLVAPEVYAVEEYSAITPSEKLPTIPPPIAFTDVPGDFWGRRFIDKLSSRGIIKGFPDYSFRPNQPVSRAEFATMLQQAFNTKVHSKGFLFEDVSQEYWAAPAIDRAIGAGFLKGYPDKTFKPQQNISRVQVLLSLASGLNLKESSSPEQVLSVYEDVGDIPRYAIAKVAAATENSIVVNYPDAKFLAPNKEATRAEVASMIHQALVRTGRLQPIKSQNVVTLPE
jgi:hypothetical protein